METNSFQITQDITHSNGQDKSGPDIIILKFADSAVPVFKEERNKDYIKYGEDNFYPDYLTYLFTKCGKHNAILNGKANYIFGGGFENGNQIVNRNSDSLNDISRKAILDVCIYGGFRLEIIYDYAGKISEIYHVDFNCLRKGKGGEFYFKESWGILGSSGRLMNNTREEEKSIPGFNPSAPKGSQIFDYNEYRPGVRFYPLPDYIGANNYIEADIEISKFHLSAIRNGMAPSKLIQFFKGEPTEDKKREIERRFKNKFGGSENAGNFILVFNNGQEKSVEINDLTASELDKQFDILGKTTTQEIFAGHQVTSPMLFGIMEPGKLGGAQELKTAYEIFINTYAKPKAQGYDREINWLMSFSKWPDKYELEQTDPIGLQFTTSDVINILPKQFIFEKLGIPEDLWNLQTIAGVPAVPLVPSASEINANDNVKNLTAKQHQQLVRIIRQYSKGQLTEAAARTLLKTGLSLNDDDINNLLGIESSFEIQEEEIIAMFDACGESKKDYEIIKSKKVSFEIEDLEEDEQIFIREAFKEYDVTITERQIVDLIQKDKRITPKIIAETIGETESYVTSRIANLTKRGYIESKISTVGIDEIIERAVSKDIIKPPIKPGEINPAKISIKYSYEGPQDDRNRPFCAKMMELNRLYNRYDIELISQRLGYSVFDRRGGFYTRKGTNNTTPYCRHNWVSHITIKKGGTSVNK